MGNTLYFDSKTSIKETISPFLNRNLETSGWALIKIKPSEKIESEMLIISALVGQIFSDCIGYHTIDITDSEETLAIHTECISNEDGIVPFFALGCIKPSVSGGETRIFDGRMAAKIIDDIPALSDVIIEYSALANPSARISYLLVVPEHGRTVRYRSKVETNFVLNSGDLSEDEMYNLVDDVIHKSLIVSHAWNSGDLLFVNNLFTLHDRLPFMGNRKMLRVRYNDKLNSRIRY